ncbi:unnamed protein product, partial [marine sediment metagenome]
VSGMMPLVIYVGIVTIDIREKKNWISIFDTFPNL